QLPKYLIIKAEILSSPLSSLNQNSLDIGDQVQIVSTIMFDLSITQVFISAVTIGMLIRNLKIAEKSYQPFEYMVTLKQKSVFS
ncbi:5414_t:CDS:2, partial [Funneliformis mosseae]